MKITVHYMNDKRCKLVLEDENSNFCTFNYLSHKSIYIIYIYNKHNIADNSKNNNY